MTFDFKKANVYSYHLVIEPSIPEDSRTLRHMILKEITGDMKEKFGGDFYTSGMTVFANAKVEGLNTFTCNVNKTDFAVKMDFDTHVNLEDLYSTDENVNKLPAI